jgi:hypothetical protein
MVRSVGRSVINVISAQCSKNEIARGERRAKGRVSIKRFSFIERQAAKGERSYTTSPFRQRKCPAIKRPNVQNPLSPFCGGSGVNVDTLLELRM